MANTAIKEGSCLKYKQSHTISRRPFQCTKCNKYFSQKKNLQMHQRMHSGEKKHKCNECNKAFIQRAHLVKHQRVHTREKPYQCTECNKSFSVKGNLQRHQRIHKGEKPYKCTVCNRCFSLKRSLHIHQRIHTGEKPYKCYECNKCFSQKVNLRRHLRIHTGEKPYKCTVCNKCFNQKGTLHTHQGIHTRKKSYKCTDCDRRFSQRGELQRHKKRQLAFAGEKPHHRICCNTISPEKRNRHEKAQRQPNEEVRKDSNIDCEKCFSEREHHLVHINTLTRDHALVIESEVEAVEQCCSYSATEGERNECWVCQMKVASFSDMIKHIDEHFL